MIHLAIAPIKGATPVADINFGIVCAVLVGVVKDELLRLVCKKGGSKFSLAIYADAWYCKIAFLIGGLIWTNWQGWVE